jgi:Putative 2OG-Fe(II) oxygenase
MILFPAYYEHAVIPFRGTGVRTCIAFNAADF